MKDGGLESKWLTHVLENWQREFLPESTLASDGALAIEGADPADGAIYPPKVLDWDPRGRIWYFNASRKLVRRTPALKQFKEFLEVSSGSDSLV